MVVLVPSAAEREAEAEEEDEEEETEKETPEESQPLLTVDFSQACCIFFSASPHPFLTPLLLPRWRETHCVCVPPPSFLPTGKKKKMHEGRVARFPEKK